MEENAFSASSLAHSWRRRILLLYAEHFEVARLRVYAYEEFRRRPGNIVVFPAATFDWRTSRSHLPFQIRPIFHLFPFESLSLLILAANRNQHS
jgi:hypothetical protein